MALASKLVAVSPRAVLFDFDGTFADTAPDMAFAANMLRTRRGLDTLPLASYRPFVSNGGRGMVWVAFGKTPEDAEFTALRDEFLDAYEQHLCVNTVYFDGIEPLLAALEARDIAWGIVTNKAKRFTAPIMQTLGLDRRTKCIVSGDTTPYAKPHPAPLLHAASIVGVPAAACWYVGDDIRDIAAARAAGMRSIVAEYGYLGGLDPTTWDADWRISHPHALLGLLDA